MLTHPTLGLSNNHREREGETDRERGRQTENQRMSMRIILQSGRQRDRGGGGEEEEEEGGGEGGGGESGGGGTIFVKTGKVFGKHLKGTAAAALAEFCWYRRDEVIGSVCIAHHSALFLHYC